jgi:hypothetical protein
MLHRKISVMVAIGLVIGLVGATPAVAATPQAKALQISDANLKALTSTMGGAQALPTSRTVAHWWGSTVDPNNGVTYGYNMVGADPNNCSGSACDVIVQADITPINVNIDGLSFNGTSILAGTLASPQFATNDYGSTTAATIPSCGTGTAECRGAGGVLSQTQAGQQLQLEDATMRSQFNKGATNYHVRLHPNVLPAVTINVPNNQGVLLQSGRGVIFADVNISWWAAQIQNLETKADPTHLPIYLTDSVLLHIGKDPLNCCVIGFHGANAAGLGKGRGKTNGNAPIQTFAWASWVRPGIYARPNGGTDWALQDIHALSHEIAEWADDPFVNNLVEPWLTPTAPQYGCTNILETGDPVVAIGFSVGSNTTDQTANPWTSPTNHSPSVSYDGTYHPEDEVFLPWFMRTAPNTVSEPTQSPSTNIGRYTLMGDLNPFAGFRQPATGC